jgi:uncharacterized protein (TIGR02118 family)
MKTKISLLFVVLGLMFGCQQSKMNDSPKINKGMIKVTVFYPNGEGKTFDMDYYSTKHMSLVKTLLGDSVKVISIDKGLASGTPDTPVPYLAIGYLHFETMSAFQNSMGPASEKLMADLPNFTNIQPVIQISEVQQ